MENLVADFRFGFRMLGRNPGSTAIAVADLTLGIGANTAMDLPFHEPQRLVMVWERPPDSKHNNVVQSGNFLDWRDRNRVFERIAALHQLPMNLTGEGEPEQRCNAWIRASRPSAC